VSQLRSLIALKADELAIAEAQNAITQAKNVQKLTVLAFLFVGRSLIPLFGRSANSMVRFSSYH
jgi:hypothetical protein